MKRLLPNTVFARLFALIFAALVVSHLIVSAIFITQGGDHGPPPGGNPPIQGERPPPPPKPPGGPGNGVWAILGVQFVALTLAAWFGAKTIARPMQNLAQAASRLGDNLNEPPMEESGPEEARSAARVFNRMQENIRSQIEARGRFLAAVSHDLRTPLTRMKLRIEQFPDAPGKDKLRDDIAEMAAMLDATLNYLRGESQSESWQMLDIQALAESMAEDARENGQDVTLTGQAKPIPALPLSLRRCLGNLIENALRYGHKAEIHLMDSPASLVIEIRDEGPGIPENRMVAVFEPFVRLEESRNKNTGGVGLGLSIAREATRRNGGELTLHNAPEGGLIARLTLRRTP